MHFTPNLSFIVGRSNSAAKTDPKNTTSAKWQHISAIFWLGTGKFDLMAQLRETPVVKRMPVYGAFRNYNSFNYTDTHTVILTYNVPFFGCGYELLKSGVFRWKCLNGPTSLPVSFGKYESFRLVLDDARRKRLVSDRGTWLTLLRFGCACQMF